MSDTLFKDCQHRPRRSLLVPANAAAALSATAALAVAAALAVTAVPVRADAQADATRRGCPGDQVVTTRVSGLADSALAMAVQRDGKLVVVGHSGMGAQDWTVMRYDSNGALDATFGSNGIVRTAFSGGSAMANAVAVQPDGKIVAAGIMFESSGSLGDFGLARYRTDGSLDPSFGSGGMVRTDVGGHDGIRALAIQPDGRLVVAGYMHSYGTMTFAATVARYNPDGSLDTRFNSDGTFLASGAVLLNEASALGLQRDGKIVIAGNGFNVVRLNRDGTPDTGFGAGGKVTADLSAESAEADALVIQPDGKILAAGMASKSNVSGGFALARYLSNGRPDSRFGTGGTVYMERVGGIKLGQVLGLALRNGQILAAGWVSNGASMDLGVAAYRRDGTLDTRFGTGGVVTGDFTTGAGKAQAIAVIRGGLVMAGYHARSSFESDVALMFVCDR